jgi:hypothetical protein
MGWAVALSANPIAKADDGDIVPMVAGSWDIVPAGADSWDIAPTVAGSWDTALTGALPAVMGFSGVAETVAMAVVALAGPDYTVVDTRSSHSSTK